MKYEKLLTAAFQSLAKNGMRSFLTMLGIIIGVAAVIIMVAVGEGAQLAIKRQIAALGSSLLIIFPNTVSHMGVSQGAGSLNQLTLDDVERLRRESLYLRDISAVAMAWGHIIGGGNNWMTGVQGVDANYTQIRDWRVVQGAFFTEEDVKTRNKVCVLGKTVVDNLFPGQDPVGALVRIRSVPFKVIGVLAKKGQSSTGNDQDDIILSPTTTVLYRLKGGQNINLIMASAVSDARIPAAQQEIRMILRESHRLHLGEEDDFTVRNQAEITDTAAEASRTLTILLGSIAGVSLVVGGIGIMNIMLVSVTERTREIGLRMALGARSRDILSQFLIEAVSLSLLGGIIGIAISFATAYLLNLYSNFEAVLLPQTILLAVAFSAAVGIFFGFYPARRASQLNPIEALRYE
jgi:putative ABC transport system permease protein